MLFFGFNLSELGVLLLVKNKKGTSLSRGVPTIWVEDRVRTGDPRYHKPML